MILEFLNIHLFLVLVSSSILISGLSFSNMIKFFRYYLFSIGILLLLRSVILLIVSLDENFLEVIESAEPLLFSADLLGLLLFGGILSTRDPKVLQRHILLSITATIIFLLIATKSVAENKSLSFFILCAVIFLFVSGSIFFQCVKSFLSLKYGREFALSLLFTSFLSVLFWLVIFSAQLNTQETINFQKDFEVFWLGIKMGIIYLCIFLKMFMKEEVRDHILDFVVDETNKKTQKLAEDNLALNYLPYPLILINEKRIITFANLQANKIIGISVLESRKMGDVFLAEQILVDGSMILFRCYENRMLQMFKCTVEKITWKKKVSEILILEFCDFNFNSFSNSLVNRVHGVDGEIHGILDHNFAIYRMSGSWKKLLDPIDRFSHSGLIWDKLRLLSLDKAEVNHLENCISSAPNAEGWFNIRTAHSLRVRLEKLYAPDYKHFYYFYGKHTFKKEEETEEREEEHFKFRFQA
ncbi:MAG: hypothetical protein CBC42_04080 [Betaproteobacteria bacterium TMED82]|nr:MAG: hypothetical protein CBC42_04080 [Betaproteobacteria bacterium TMED82]